MTTPRHAAFALVSLTAIGLFALIPLPPTVEANAIHALILLAMMGGCWVAYTRGYPGDGAFRLPLPLLIAISVGVIVLAAIRLRGLAAFPFIDWQDEPWTLAWTLHYLRTGVWGDPTMRGLGDPYYAYPRVYVTLAAWLSAFGVGLWQARAWGYLGALLLTLFTFFAARNLYGRRAGWIAAAFMLTSAIVFSAARIRHDIGLAVAVAAGIWLYSEAVRRRRGWLHGAAGFVTAGGGFGHYHVAALGLALFAGLYGSRWIAQRRHCIGARGKRHAIPECASLWFIVGGVIGAAAVVGLQILPDDLPGFLADLTRQSKYSDDSGQFLTAFFGNFITIGLFSIYEAIAIGIAVIAALRRRRPLDLAILIALLVAHGLLAVLASGAIYYYILPLTPLYALLIASIFDQREARAANTPPLTQSRRAAYGWALLLIPIAGHAAAGSLAYAISGAPMEPPTPPAVVWVLANTPSDAVVAGDLRYFLWMPDRQFANHLIPNHLYPEREWLREEGAALWRAADADVFIVDPGLPRSYQFFRPLVESGWFAASGYREAARFANPTPGEPPPTLWSNGRPASGETVVYVREKQ